MDQTQRDLIILRNFSLKCYAVFKKYAKVCVQFDSGFEPPVNGSVLLETELYLQEIQKIFSKICKNFYQLVNRRKIYILIRILCKSRLTLEKYLIHLNYWELSGNL